MLNSSLAHNELMSFIAAVAAVVTEFAAGLMVQTETPQERIKLLLQHNPLSNNQSHAWFIDVIKSPDSQQSHAKKVITDVTI